MDDSIQMSPQPYSMYTSFACDNSSAMTLQCPSGSTTIVTRAVWGDHFFGVCDSDECCPPHPAYDDFVDMETNETLTFELIKLQCDGETSCDVEYIPYDIPVRDAWLITCRCFTTVRPTVHPTPSASQLKYPATFVCSLPP